MKYLPKDTSFKPSGELRMKKTKQSVVAAQRGVAENGVDCIALSTRHVCGNRYDLALSIEGAKAVIEMLSKALKDEPTT